MVRTISSPILRRHWDTADSVNWTPRSVRTKEGDVTILCLPGSDDVIGFSGRNFYRQVSGLYHTFETGLHAVLRAVMHGLSFYRNEIPVADQAWQRVGGENVKQIDTVTLNAFDLWAVNSRLNFGHALQMLKAMRDSRKFPDSDARSIYLKQAIDQLEIVANTPLDRLGRVNNGMIQARSAAAMRAIMRLILLDRKEIVGLSNQLMLVMQLVQQVELDLERGATSMHALIMHAADQNGASRLPHHHLHRAGEHIRQSGIPPYNRVVDRVVRELGDISEILEDDDVAFGANGQPLARYRGRDITSSQWADVGDLASRAYYSFQLARQRGPLERLIWNLGEDGLREFPGQKDARKVVLLADMDQIQGDVNAINETGFRRPVKADLASAIGQSRAYLDCGQFPKAKDALKAAFDPKNPLI